MISVLKRFIRPALFKVDNWWVEIQTDQPNCIYFFGPFADHEEARVHHHGYVEDLEVEGAEGIRVWIKRCQPSCLTIEEN